LGSFDGKVFIVTGASDGIGAEIVKGLRACGGRIVLTARDNSRLKSLAAPGDLVVAGDITQDATRTSLVARTLERFGRIDGLINNAGRGSYYSASESPLDDARSLFELNFFAPLHLAQLVTPSLRISGGSLVNIGSIASRISLPWLPVYSASKFALAALTTAQRNELRRAGIHVMSVFPGYVDTGFHGHAAGGAPPAVIAKGKRFAVSAEHCALAVLNGIEARRNTVVTPRIGWVLIWLNRLFPWAVEERMGRV
jgi:short-subunit dehydrogenase